MGRVALRACAVVGCFVMGTASMGRACEPCRLGASYVQLCENECAARGFTTVLTVSGGVNQEGAPEETWLSEGDAEFKKSHARAWDVALFAVVNHSTPSGDYYDGCGAGQGFGGDLLIAVGRRAAVRLSASRAGVEWEDPLKFESTTPGVRILTADASLSALRFSLSGFFHHPLQSPDLPSMLYGYVGFGMIRHQLEVEVLLEDTSSGQTSREKGDDVLNEFMLTAGGGVTFAFSPRVGVDVGVGLDLFSHKIDSEYYVNATSGGIIFDLKAGVVLFL